MRISRLDQTWFSGHSGVLAIAVIIVGLTLPQIGAARQDAGQSQKSQQDGDNKRVRRLRDSLAVDPDREWVPGLENSDRSQELERKLSMAEQALAAGNLLQPEHANALEYFNAVLEINAEHLRAREGIEQIVTMLLDQARDAVAAGDDTAARQLLGSVDAIMPGHAVVASLENQLLQRAQLESLLSAAQQQISAGELTQPVDGNALASLNAAARIEPDNEEVLAGLAEVRTLLIADAAAAVDADEFDQADRLLELAAGIEGQASQIAEARAGVLDARQRDWRFQAEDIATIIAVGQLELAAADLETLAASGFKGPELEDLRAQLAAARILRDYPAQSTFRDAFVASDGAGPLMVVIGEGAFSMGSPKSERGRKEKEGPQQRIEFDQSFALGVTEISVGQFRQFVEATDYQTDVEQGGQTTIYDVADGTLKKISGISWRRDYENKSAGDKLPAIHVSWNDAMAYVQWLTETTGKVYRLASESEFEYSLRAGSTTRYWWGDSAPKEKVENVTGQRDKNDGPWEWPKGFRRYDDGYWGPAPVASYRSNPNGAHDLGGNVMEWLADCYRSTLEGIPTDGSARSDGNCALHVVKGASWASMPDLARSAYRSSAKSGRAASIIGFRVARDL